MAGAFETLTDEQIRKQMEVNFFGLIDVTRKGRLVSVKHCTDYAETSSAAMETMRELKTGGLIQQVTSIGGMSSSYRYGLWETDTLEKAKRGYRFSLRIARPNGLSRVLQRQFL